MRHWNVTARNVCRKHRLRKLRLATLEDRTLPSGAQFVPGDLIIKFRTDATDAQKAAAYSRVAASDIEQLQTDAMRDAGAGALEVMHGLADTTAAADQLKAMPGVEYAEPNWIYSTEDVSNDTLYTNGSLWGMYGDDLPSAAGPAGTTNQFGSQAEKAWAAGATGSSNVYVGVIDEGIQFTHPDLAPNVWTNPYDPVDGVDNDGNGFVDDSHGWDFFNNDNSIYDAGGDSHGTHVTGTIGAKGGNGIGVAGVNWNVTAISGKFLGPSGGTTLGAIRALDYFTDLKNRHGLNIVATNNSWGGGGFSQSLLDAITRAANRNILFIAAAGNSSSNNDVTASYPSNYNTTPGTGYDSVIAVAAIGSNGTLASFSSYGASTVDIGAPGVGVISTVPNNSYASFNGTSMATPHVTGAAALYASTHPGSTALQIKNAILNAAIPTASLAGKTLTGGRLDVGALAPSGPSMSINDVSLAEGDSGPTAFTFNVALSAPSNQTVTVQYSTADGTATNGSGDYSSTSGTLTFGPRVTSQPVTVYVNGDTASEPDETFVVNLLSAVNASIDDSQGLATVRNDDGAISINDVSLSEGNTGTTAFTFTISLANASTKTISVDYSTGDGTAGAPIDYAADIGSVSFAPGDLTRTVTVAVNGDIANELNETFFVNLNNPINAAITDGQGVGTIQNDDSAISMAINDVSVIEGNVGTVNAAFTVSLSMASTQTVTVSYVTAEITATSGVDYTTSSGFLTFTPGQTSKTILVPIISDTIFEPNETFLVNLRSAIGASVADFQGVGTIIDDDTIGTDGFGYTAYGHPFENLDLVPGDFGVTTILSSGDDSTVLVKLGASFNYYGTAYSTLFVSSNGLITFDSGNSAYQNSDLTVDPTQRSLAPMWDDWVNTTGQAMILARVDSINGVKDRVVFEWNNVQGFGGSPSTVTFQTILKLNTSGPGDIIFNYPDLNAGHLLSNGGSATVGFKDSGTQGSRRLLISMNTGTNPYVASGKAILISKPESGGLGETQGSTATSTTTALALNAPLPTWDAPRSRRSGLTVGRPSVARKQPKLVARPVLADLTVPASLVPEALGQISNPSDSNSPRLNV